MKITNDLVERLAVLARLQFDASEKESIGEDLQRIISFVDKLNELDTAGVEPLQHISDNVNQWREDVPGNMVSAEEALRNAKLKDKKYFKVPKVIKKI